MSLRVKLTLLNLLLIFIVGSILTIFTATYQKRDLLQEKLLRAHSLLDNLIVQNREALILQDRFALEISSNRFLKNQDILFLLVDLYMIKSIYEEVSLFQATSAALGIPVWIYYIGVPIFSVFVFAGIYREAPSKLNQIKKEEGS